MKNKHLNQLLIVAVLTCPLAIFASETEPVKNVIITANDSMRFSLTEIDAKPGQSIHVILQNDGNLPKDVLAHNWVLLKSGLTADSYSAAAVSYKSQGFEPASLSGEVLASIPLVGPKQTGEITFTAPTEPGTYHYLCSFPAHCQAGMHGDLVVK